MRLPDTGQTTSYTTTFGEDADYNFNMPAFILSGNGTVIDTITSLMWQQTDGGEMTIENAALYCDTLTLGGYTDWRLPNCHELFSILNHDKVNPAIDINYFTHTLAEYWWSSQRQANDTTKVWVTNAGGGVGSERYCNARNDGEAMSEVSFHFAIAFCFSRSISRYAHTLRNEG